MNKKSTPHRRASIVGRALLLATLVAGAGFAASAHASETTGGPGTGSCVVNNQSYVLSPTTATSGVAPDWSLAPATAVAQTGAIGVCSVDGMTLVVWPASATAATSGGRHWIAIPVGGASATSPGKHATGTAF